MKNFNYLLAVIVFAVASCGTPKTYFSTDIRNRIEGEGIPLTKLQYYVDRDIELRRELVTGETKVASGVIKFENGKNVNIITLKKNTPGVCTSTYPDKLLISFDTGNDKFLTFGKTKSAGLNDPYRILANDWVDDYGVIMYEGKKYYILPSGNSASIQVKTKVLNNNNIDKREMKGRKVE